MSKPAGSAIKIWLDADLVKAVREYAEGTELHDASIAARELIRIGLGAVPDHAVITEARFRAVAKTHEWLKERVKEAVEQWQIDLEA